MTNPRPNAFGQNHQKNKQGKSIYGFSAAQPQRGKNPVFSLFVINLRACITGPVVLI
jgi:hypothetical protein